MGLLFGVKEVGYFASNFGGVLWDEVIQQEKAIREYTAHLKGVKETHSLK